MTTYPHLARIDREQRLFVIDHGSHVSCLGFDVLADRTDSYAQFARRPALASPARKGTQLAFRRYSAALAAAQAHNATTGERDTSDLNPQLTPYRGKLVAVSPDYRTMCGRDRRTFIVGQTTGWRPATLLMNNRRSRGSSEIIPASLHFDSVEVVG